MSNNQLLDHIRKTGNLDIELSKLNYFTNPTCEILKSHGITTLTQLVNTEIAFLVLWLPNEGRREIERWWDSITNKVYFANGVYKVKERIA